MDVAPPVKRSRPSPPDPQEGTRVALGADDTDINMHIDSSDDDETRDDPEALRRTQSSRPLTEEVVVPQTAEQWRALLESQTKVTSSYNAELLYERQHERGLFFDTNTNQTHIPSSKGLRLLPWQTKGGRYPIALMQGQHCDACVSCTKADIQYQWALDSGAIDDSEEVSDEDDAASIAADGPEVEDQNAKVDSQSQDDGQVLCAICNQTENKNKKGEHEAMVTCSTCSSSAHPTCIEITDPELTKVIRTYNWQCMECKVCVVCNDPGDEDECLFCDACDAGYHTYCVGLAQAPKGRWVCNKCGKCNSCGRLQSGENSQTRWKHEYSKPSDSTKEPVFLQTLWAACSKQFRIGNYCPVCLKVYRNNETELPMVCCDTCESWIHIACDNIDEKTYESMTDSEQPYECPICRNEIKDKVRT